MTEKQIGVNEKPFRILCVSDLHARASWLNWLTKVSVDYDCVSIAGDITDIAIPMTFAHGFRIKNILNSIKCPIVLAEGNHESWATGWWNGFCSVPSEKTLHLPGHFRQIGPLCFGSFVYRGKNSIPHITAPQFWVAHEPPFRSITGRIGASFFSACQTSIDFLRKKYQPLFYHCGHIHEAPWDGGRWYERLGHTWAFNAGSYSNLGTGKGIFVPPHITIEYYNSQNFSLTWHDPLNGYTETVSSQDMDTNT